MGKITFLNYNNNPQAIVSAFARISRKDKPLDEIYLSAINEEITSKEQPDYKGSSPYKTNLNILRRGHKSVAEHAVFNIAFEDFSRLFSSYLVTFRLASFTQQSQRYVKLFTKYYSPCILNEEIKSSYHKVIQKLFHSYNLLSTSLKTEDARYLLPLACFTRVGATFNARELRYFIEKSLAHPQPEVVEAAKELEKLATGIAPSLFKDIKPLNYEWNIKSSLKKFFPPPTNNKTIRPEEVKVTLLTHTPKPQIQLIATILSHFSGESIHKSLEIIQSFLESYQEEFLNKLWNGFSYLDTPIRDLEHIQFTFSIRCSLACYHQLIRHRMCTITSLPLQLPDSYTLPVTVKETNNEKWFRKIIEDWWQVYLKIYNKEPLVAEYLLLNAVQREVIVTMNLRELYHFWRLRCCMEAQWEIREVANQILESIKEKFPLLTLKAGPMCKLGVCLEGKNCSLLSLKPNNGVNCAGNIN